MPRQYMDLCFRYISHPGISGRSNKRVTTARLLCILMLLLLPNTQAIKINTNIFLGRILSLGNCNATIIMKKFSEDV
jgi:hypothetical protein